MFCQSKNSSKSRYVELLLHSLGYNLMDKEYVVATQ